jgi:hypothetical protein
LKGSGFGLQVSGFDFSTDFFNNFGYESGFGTLLVAKTFDYVI